MTTTAALTSLLVLFGQTAAPPTAPASSSTRLSGLVISAQTGAPLAGVRIVLVPETAPSSATSTPRETRADRDGRFVIENLPVGPATMTVSTIGYIFVRRRIELTTAGVEVTVPLAEGTGTYEEAVTVSPGASVAPAGDLRELSSGALQDLRGVAADDPVRAVQALPGVASADDFQAEFSVRGSAYRHVGLVVDGVATPLLFHSVRGVEDSGSIAMINTDVIERASIRTGAHPATHGNWLGATLEFDMREGSRDRVAVRGAVSGTNASTVAEGPLTPEGKGSWLVSLRKSYVDWLVRKIDPDITGTIGFLDGQTKIVYDLTPRQTVQLLVLGGNATYRDITARTANEIAKATSTSVLGSLRWRYAADRMLISSRLSAVRHRYLNRGLLFQERARGTTDATMWRTDVTIPVNRWSVEAGTHVEDQRTITVFRNFQTVTPTTQIIRAERRSDAGRVVTAGWMNVGGRAVGLGLTTGLRVSHDSFDGRSHASPWLLVERDVKMARLVFSAARSVQYVSLDYAGASPEPLVPETAWMVDGGLKGAVTPRLFWSATVFRRHESDVLRRINENRLVGGTRVVESTFPTVASRLAGRSRGFDLAFERRADTGPTGWVAYSWAHTRFDDRVTGEAFDGDFDQRHTVNAFVQQRLSYRFRASAKFRYGSNVPVVGYFTGVHDALQLGSERNTVRLPSYARLDLSGSRTFTFTRSRMTLFVEIMNVLNRRNYGPSDGSIRSTLAAIDYSEKLIPILPSAGMLLEF